MNKNSLYFLIIITKNFLLDDGLSVESDKANENGLLPEESSSISVPASIISLIPNKENINVIFVAYNNSFLFPIRTRRRDSNQTSSRDLAIGSQVIGFSIPGIPEGTELPEPVNISLRLANPRTGTLEVIHIPRNISIVSLSYSIEYN